MATKHTEPTQPLNPRDALSLVDSIIFKRVSPDAIRSLVNRRTLNGSRLLRLCDLVDTEAMRQAASEAHDRLQQL